MDRQRALDLAAKLLAMDANNGCTAEEAANAAAKLAKLAQEHDISMLDIQAAQMKDRIKVESAACPWPKPPSWLYDLVGVVTDAFRCRAVFKGREQTIEIIGEETEAALCRYFIGYLIQALPDGYTAYWKSTGKHRVAMSWGAVTGHKLKISWFAGAITAIYDRLKKLYADWFDSLDESQKGKARGLIVVKNTAVKEFVASRYPTLRTLKSQPKSLDGSSYFHGQQHGQDINLSQGLRGGATNNPKLNG